MRARTIGRWVGRAAVFVALGVGFWAVVGFGGGLGTSVASGHAHVADGSDGRSGKQAQFTTMDFEWS